MRKGKLVPCERVSIWQIDAEAHVIERHVRTIAFVDFNHIGNSGRPIYLRCVEIVDDLSLMQGQRKEQDGDKPRHLRDTAEHRTIHGSQRNRGKRSEGKRAHRV